MAFVINKSMGLYYSKNKLLIKNISKSFPKASFANSKAILTM